ncbi:hypothetical protein AB0H42_19205 [Nocardia sp. NPDC050799]|uniref:hypothetical protein n=1 Tax=Nocardia sp. NPDC050799 TaxID=3154842 RepID=UPI0033C6D8C8
MQRLYDERETTVQQIADMFDVPRSTVDRRLDHEKTHPHRPRQLARVAAHPRIPAKLLVLGLAIGLGHQVGDHQQV